MDRNIEDIKNKIMEKLPDILPKVVKSVVVHIVMLICHVSMPPWVTAIRIKKSMGSRHTEGIERENRRRMRRSRRRHTYGDDHSEVRSTH